MRFLVLFTLVLALSCVIYCGFIQFVDPYGEYGTGTFPVLVLDSRRAKLQLLHRFAEQGPVGGLILGSSRSLLMRPELLSGSGESRVFNFAVDNAHAEDFLAIYHYAIAQKINPKFLVIGLDIASLHSDDAHDHMFDRSELKNYLENTGDTSSWPPMKWLSDVKSLYTKDYLKDAFKAIWMKLRHQTPKTKFAVDGYEVQYSGAQSPAGEIGPLHDFSDDVKSYMQRLSGMRDLSHKRLNYLRQLFTEARQHNATVVVWLTPIHPRLNELITQNTNYADLIKKVNVEAENWVSAYGIHYKDYSDIRTFGGLETAWSDSTHLDWRNMDRVAHALVGEVPHGL
jgi:hypothetical protein